MGYAHIWKRPVELPAAAFAIWSDEVAKVIAAANVSLCGLLGDGEPVITPTRVAFNGDQLKHEAREAFIIEQTDTTGFRIDAHSYNKDEWYFGRDWRCSICKTGRLPYDLIVVAALSL